LKKRSRKNLITALDAVFSKYIRTKHSVNGFVECCTCKRSYEIKKIQNGHFMSRKSYSTRWDEENCAPQCYGCNVMQQGQQFLFSKYIDEKYGEGYSQVLLIKSKQTAKFADFELQEMIDNYTKALKDLENSM
jgi:cytochrome b involved in lipid metabolism